jgi:hypothetical protein
MPEAPIVLVDEDKEKTGPILDMVYSGLWRPILWTSGLWHDAEHTFYLTMEAVGPCDILVTTYQTTRRRRYVEVYNRYWAHYKLVERCETKQADYKWIGTLYSHIKKVPITLYWNTGSNKNTYIIINQNSFLRICQHYLHTSPSSNVTCENKLNTHKSSTLVNISSYWRISEISWGHIHDLLFSANIGRVI